MPADPGVIISYPVSPTDASPLVLGPGARLRSGTVLYDGTTIAQCLQTGRGMVVQEARAACGEHPGAASPGSVGAAAQDVTGAGAACLESACFDQFH
jgi:hypothetical protein